MPESLLLEIGVEEFPARFCAMALEQVAARGASLLRDARLAFEASRALGTPRRIAWLVEGLAARQPDAHTAVRGPARAAAFDPSGAPTKAALGFARGQGVPVESLTVEAAGGREYVFARRRAEGRPAAEVLAELLPRLVASLEFPRTMRWGAGDFRFPRPIRWLVALLGTEVVPFSIEGLASGRVTYGHRTLHPGAVPLHRPQDYVEALRAAHVLADPEERRRRIAEGVRATVAAAGGRPRENPELLEEITHLCEWPSPFAGLFDPAALAVPEVVLVTVMRVHQRYFPVESAEGRLLPQFAGVRDGGPDGLRSVAAGNEKVLAARFADARFFFDEDRREPLEARVSRLGSVTFAEGLGSLADKTARLERLAGWLAARAGESGPLVGRAARLCKADRLTHLVYELPELEGAIGALYAAADGEPGPVCQAIGEHVLPRAAGDALPASGPGRVLAVADRLDTLAGHFMRGRAPTGSADPFGLRRAGAALIRLLEDAGWEVDLAAAASEAAAGFPEGTGEPEGLDEFLRGRLRGRMEEVGIRHDVADAVLAAGVGSVADAFARARALAAAAFAPGWEDVMVAWRRAANLARQGGAGAHAELPAADALREPAERALRAALEEARERAGRARAARDHASVLQAVALLRRPLDEMLTALLVMDPDPQVRARRLGLLAAVAAVPASVADLGRLVEQG